MSEYLQVLAWNPALDRTTKTLQRLLCVPELVLIVDDSPAAWSNHLSNLLLIDRFIGCVFSPRHSVFVSSSAASQSQVSHPLSVFSYHLLRIRKVCTRVS